MTCPRCGVNCSDCKYPLSHAHPTTKNVKLPERVYRAAKKHFGVDYADRLTSQDRDTLNRKNLYPLLFHSEIPERELTFFSWDTPLT